MKSVPQDAWTGLSIFVAAVLLWHEADEIKSSPLDDAVGAAGLPKLLAIALMCLSALLVIRAYALKKGSTPAGFERRARSLDYHAHAKAAGLFLLGCGYILLLNTLGYSMTIAILLFCVAWYSGAAPRLHTVIFALVGASTAYLIFVLLLSIPMPQGRLALWLAGL